MQRFRSCKLARCYQSISAINNITCCHNINEQFAETDFPNISLGTVYRNLNFLVDHGEALRLDMGDGNDHFTAMLMASQPFLLPQVHHVLDLEMDGINHIDVIANAGFDGIIEGHTIYFTGLCPDCAQAKMP